MPLDGSRLIATGWTPVRGESDHTVFESSSGRLHVDQVGTVCLYDLGCSQLDKGVLWELLESVRAAVRSASRPSWSYGIGRIGCILHYGSAAMLRASSDSCADAVSEFAYKAFPKHDLSWTEYDAHQYARIRSSHEVLELE